MGEDRDWGLVFVDNRPGNKRSENAGRLARRAQLVIHHDTHHNHPWFPRDWIRTKHSPNPRWDGRRVHTDWRQGNNDVLVVAAGGTDWD